ncbi:indole-3-glycerol-phosphate synthase [Streptomyces sp. AC602_WCS936]|uniref:indole-3-glycerol-phosphate synthase n=1 Tax=Streptomyces sp. AC602_WCS936 TaxID=2823685 RepID=UPI001C2569AB|nr:indole-3-glycerol-phosphate synthase [Streptomyces sp. AC602_WCS936]
MDSAFVEALLGARRPLVMEIKPRDAHGADLVAGRTPADLVAAYEKAGAPCLSVVTGRWFGGTPALLGEVARHASVPLLQKDFITRRDQLVSARELGASAVLLTAGLLPVTALRTLVDAALREGLTPFVEITSEAELERVPRPGDCVIAVNNKDIKTRERDAADLSRSHALLPALRAAGTPCPVSASGIETPSAAAELLAAGYRGLLIGTALLRSGNLDAWPTARPRLLANSGIPSKLNL